MQKRWGNELRDSRDWPEYNEQLVVRGEFYLDFEFAGKWNEELAGMNEGRRGGQYRFPSSSIRWLAVWKQWIDYGGLEGVTRSLAGMNVIPSAIDFTTIWYRAHAMKPEIALPAEDGLEAASDGSGRRSGNAGEYRTMRYGRRGKKRKYAVVVMTADVRRKKLLAVDAHIEGEGKAEPVIAGRHLKRLKSDGKAISGFYGDGAYDTNDMFDALGDTESVIKIRTNASTDYCRGSKRRRGEVREYNSLGYRKRAEQSRYGMRWPGTEGIFSAAKRKFGENLMATSRRGLTAEAIQRMWAYDIIKCHGEGMVTKTT